MNKKTIFILLAMLAMLSCRRKVELVQEDDGFDKSKMLSSIANNYILKRLNHFSIILNKLEATADEFNNAPSLLTLEKVKNNWKETNRIWKECKLYNIGEVKDTYAHLRIETRPSNQSFIELNIADTTLIDNLYFETIGFSSKGLGAIEYLLLHDVESVVLNEFNQNRRKLYLKWAIDDMKKNLLMINNAWNQGYLTNFKNSVTPGITSSINIIVNKLVELNEKIYQTKIGFPIGKKNGIIDASKTEAPISKESLKFIEHNLISIEQTFELGLYSYIDYLKLKKDSKSLSNALREQIKQIKTLITSMDNLEDSIESHYVQSEELYNEFKELLILLKVDVISGLNIIFVINDNDGD